MIHTLRTLRALLVKEFKILARNPQVSRIVFMMPLSVMLLMPLVANLDVKNVNVAVVDEDHSILSRRIVADMDATDHLTVTASVNTYPEALRLVEAGRVDVIVDIPPRYAADLVAGSPRTVAIDANGVNATKGTLGARYAAMSLGTTLSQWQQQQGRDKGEAPLSVRYRYNETLNFKQYMVPALMAMLLIIICGFLPALNLVGEKETGTIEAMNVTPVGKFTFVLSKLIPFWLAGMIVVTVGMLIGALVYDVTPAGNVLLIYLAAMLFSLVMSGLGVAVANKSTTILQSIFVMYAFIMIFQLMSGLFTPVSSMPQWAQMIAAATPPRYFIEIMRDVYLKGATVPDLWREYTALIAFAAGLCLIAAATYRKRS